MVSRKPLAPPPIEIKQFTLDEIERGIAKLQRRIAEVEAIDSRHAAEPSAPERSVVTSNIRETIREVLAPTRQSFTNTTSWTSGRAVCEWACLGKRLAPLRPVVPGAYWNAT